VTFDAIVLAGGRSARLGGEDKALVTVGGRTLLENAVSAVADAETTVVVGPRRELSLPVIWVEENPPGGGPVAAIAAGLPLISSELVVVLAIDHPLVTAHEVSRLLGSVVADGAAARDEESNAQPLVAAYRRDPLVAALGRLPVEAGARVRDLIAPMDVAFVDVGASARDCDTTADFDEVRRLVKLRR
jgi:molybdopterin-guanine dinucleotide biosynthesis protein A